MQRLVWRTVILRYFRLPPRRLGHPPSEYVYGKFYKCRDLRIRLPLPSCLVARRAVSLWDLGIIVEVVRHMVLVNSQQPSKMLGKRPGGGGSSSFAPLRERVQGEASKQALHRAGPAALLTWVSLEFAKLCLTSIGRFRSGCGY